MRKADKARYPADWDALSARLRAACGQRCEWCGVPNGAIGYRDARGYWHTVVTPDGCQVNGEPVAVSKLTCIVLTVAHLGAFRGPVLPGLPIPWGDPHDKRDVRPENLACLCQRCHLGYDRDDHAQHAAETRRQKRIAAGQGALCGFGG